MLKLYIMGSMLFISGLLGYVLISVAARPSFLCFDVFGSFGVFIDMSRQNIHYRKLFLRESTHGAAVTGPTGGTYTHVRQHNTTIKTY